MANQRLNKLTNFLTEHFTALALEVFGEVQSIVESYDEENKRLRSMLRTVIGPEIKLHMIDAGPYVKATTSTSEQPEEPKSSFEFQLSQPGEKSPKEEPFEFEIKWNVEQQHQPGELHTSNVASVVKEDPEQKEEKMDMMHANPVDIHVESCPDNSATSSADEGENEEHSSLSDEASTSSLIIRSTNGASNSKVKNQQNPTTTSTKMDPVVLKVIIDHHSEKLTLSSGIPDTLEQLHKTVKDTFQIHEEFILHYFDEDFGNFFTVYSISDVKPKGSIKVIIIPSIVLSLTSETDNVMDTGNVSDTPSVTSDKFPSQSSSTAVDFQFDGTSSVSEQDIILSPEREFWPKDIEIPFFSVTTETVLFNANQLFLKDGTVLNNTCIKSEILEKLADYMYSYTPYPTGLRVGQVAEALVKKHPCLTEPGSCNGWNGWMYSLKYKMGNYRTKLRKLGFPEVTCNSLSNKRPGERKPAQKVKKARKGEVKYLPHYPLGETAEHQEQQRLKILSELKKQEKTTINQLMSSTFAHRRRDVVSLQLNVKEIKDRWPALFNVSQINAEFKRITTVNLEAKFMYMLDQYIPKLLSIFQAKKGAAGERHRTAMNILLQKPKPVIQKTLLQMPRMIIDKSLILSKDEQMSFLSRLHESYNDFPEDQKPMIAQMNLTADIEMVQCAFGEVPKGSPLSYQFPVPSAKDFIVHDDAPPQPDLPLFSRILEQASDIPTLSAQEQHNLNNMYVSWEQAHNLERSTRGRKQSAKELEKMRLIGRFKEISQLKPGRSNADKLVFKIRHGKPRTFKILSGQGGPEELKLEATREYCRNLCVNLYPCGLVIPPHAPWMGAFPDGVVYDPKEKNIFGLLHTIHVEGNSYTECSFLAFWECGIQLKQSYWHYWHIQGELMVTGMMWCDLLVHSTSDMLVQRIYRDETPIKCLKKKLEEFFYYYYLPQLNDEK
uniref:Uncharacterized LOC107385540 n=1 Tax=Nothobranchius furzeri TaxID=105023 RepID=A0A8C6MI90_NOTFU